jgi:hypothetical protein
MKVDVERVKQVRDSIWKAWEEVRTMRGKKKTLPIFGVEMFLMVSLCWSAAGITGAWRRWTKQNLGKLSSISPNSTVRTPHNVEKNLDFNYNCSPGESWGCGILPRVTMSQEKAKSCKRQAASHKQQASSKVGSKAFEGKKVRQIVARHYVTKTQGASDKRQAPSSKHQAASHERLAL